MDIWRAAEILQRRKWLIVFSLVITSVLAFGATRLIGSRWVATARLLAPQTANNAGAGKDKEKDNEDSSPSTSKATNTLYNTILLSREVIEPAYKSVHEQLPDGIDLAKEIELNIVGPRLYEIQVTTSKAEKSELLANALAESFVKRNHSLNSEEAQKIVDLLKSQLKTADSELAKVREKYRSYSLAHKIIASSEEESKSAHAEIDAVRAKSNEVGQEIAGASARLADVERRLRDLAPAARPALDGPSAKSISAEIDRVGTRLAALQARYGAEYPEVKEALVTRADLIQRARAAQQTEEAIAAFERKAAQRTELQKSQADLQQKLSELKAQSGTLSATIASAEGRAQAARSLSDPYGSLASEVATRVEARASVMARLNNALIALDIAQRQNPIVVLERVSTLNPPINATAGRTVKLMALSMLCALLGSCAVILGLDSIDRRVKNIGEAEKSLPTRILAAIPQPESTLSYSELARISARDPRSLPAEAYRFLGLHLLTAAPPGMRSLMVVSAKAEQGSTTTITNLAITLAQAGHRVVLVDANMRTAELHQVFDIPNGFGFSDLLNDPTNSSFEKALLSTDVENLRIVTSGSVASNPWELFRSSNLMPVSRRFREIADYVLYDTPSGVMFTDALNLAPIVDGAILCVRALETPTGVEKRLVDLIHESNVDVLGAVLSDVPVSMVAGYENYRHYYAPQLPLSPMGLDAGPLAANRTGPLTAVPPALENPDDMPSFRREEM